MSVEKLVNNFSEKSGIINSMVERAHKEIILGNLKEAFISFSSDVNNEPCFNDEQKRMIVGLAMDYRNKLDLSIDDFNVFVDYIKKFFEK